MKFQFLLIIILLINNLYANAEITLDGTLGRSGALQGPNYLIEADLGRQVGGNLFHSFHGFNLNKHESATFSVPNSVTNIFSRVTGGNPSNIDGLIRSTTPANMYFFNPYGIMFGPNARLDVQGSFHASTADYLRFSDGERFEARQPNNSVLTLAPIEAFGFFTNTPASLSIEGSQLTVSVAKTLSLIGGNLTLNHAELKAPRGRINLSSIASIDEIIPTYDDFVVPSLRGDITLSNQSLIDVSGEGGGSIFIRGGQFFADNSAIEAKTLGSQDGGIIDMRFNTLSLTNGATLNGNTIGAGKGTSIFLRATDSITVAGENDEMPDKIQESAIYARSGIYQELTHDNLGDAGQIFLEAKNILFKDGASISVSNYGGGKGGNITLKGSDSVSFSGEGKKLGGSAVFAATYSESDAAGEAGSLLIEAKNISLTDGSYINAQTEGAGRGGNVTLKAFETIEFSGENRKGVETHIELTAFNAGNAGTLSIEANQIFLKEGASILSNTYYGAGNAGTIRLQANNLLEQTGTKKDGEGTKIRVSTNSTGNAGDIIVSAKNIVLTDGANLGSDSFASGKAGNVHVDATGTITIAGADQQGWRSMISSASNPKPETGDMNGGEGGNITIEANQLIVKDGGGIATSSIAPKGMQSSRGGDITIRIQDAVELSGVNLYGENEDGFGAGIYARSMGVENNAGDAGKIRLQAGSLMIKDGAVIENSTNNNASGGNIEIDVRGTITIMGDASHIQLQEPAPSQLEYLQGFSPAQYNQSTSGIYASSKGQSGDAGQGGFITLHAKELILSNQGKIATSSAGGGKAGSIRIEAGQLKMDNTAIITSESQLSNTYQFADIAERDNSLLVLGEVVEVRDVGNGKTGRYINTGNTLTRTTPVYTVADMEGLNELTNQYSLAEGDVVEVKDMGNGDSARFIYAYNSDYQWEAWVKVDAKVTVTFANMDELNEIQKWYSPDEDIHYHSGEVIQVSDVGYGKPATYIYARLLDPSDGWTLGQALKINDFTVTDITALQNLTENTDIVEDAKVLVIDAGNGTSSRFIYQNDNWIAFNDVRTVANITEMNQLALAKPGYIAEMTNSNTIYTGQNWIPLNSRRTVANPVERDKLAAQTGDLVKVLDTGAGRVESFFYVDGVWQKQIKGGDAGTIAILVPDGIYLSNNSAITTEAVSAGGGQINTNTENLLRLTNSKVTSSVQEGAGNGGDMLLKPQFIVLENGEIIARAFEGNGGNMNITTTSIYEFPPKLEKAIDASSKLGVDGDIVINSPDTDVSGALLALPAEFTDASNQLPSPCDARLAENMSSFVKVPSKSVVNAPNDLLSGGFMLLKPLPLDSKEQPIKNQNIITKHSIATVAQMMDCHTKSSKLARTVKKSVVQKH